MKVQKFCNGSSFDSSKGYWKWNGPSASFTKTTESAIVDRIKALDSNNGTTRTTSGTWPGSVDLK